MDGDITTLVVSWGGEITQTCGQNIQRDGGGQVGLLVAMLQTCMSETKGVGCTERSGHQSVIT